MRDIEIDLAGRTFRILGQAGPVKSAIDIALRANGGADAGAAVPDLLVVLSPLLPSTGPTPAQMAEAGGIGRQMAERGGGRIVAVISAMAAVPMRRHPDYSTEMAGALARTRALAMELAPKVLVNAVGAGVLEDEVQALVAGDRVMEGHIATPRKGRIADVVNAALFLADPANTYTTGQLLNVDGGWSIGYARSF